jgi:hypothetical protein
MAFNSTAFDDALYADAATLFVPVINTFSFKVKKACEAEQLPITCTILFNNATGQVEQYGNITIASGGIDPLPDIAGIGVRIAVLSLFGQNDGRVLEAKTKQIWWSLLPMFFQFFGIWGYKLIKWYIKKGEEKNTWG